MMKAAAVALAFLGLMAYVSQGSYNHDTVQVSIAAVLVLGMAFAVALRLLRMVLFIGLAAFLLTFASRMLS